MAVSSFGIGPSGAPQGHSDFIKQPNTGEKKIRNVPVIYVGMDGDDNQEIIFDPETDLPLSPILIPQPESKPACYLGTSKRFASNSAAST